MRLRRIIHFGSLHIFSLGGENRPVFFPPVTVMRSFKKNFNSHPRQRMIQAAVRHHAHTSTHRESPLVILTNPSI